MTRQGLVTVWRVDAAGAWSRADGEDLGETVVDLAISANGRSLATAGDDGTARVWEIGTWRELSRVRHDGGAVSRVSFGPDDRHLVTASSDRTVRQWLLRADDLTAEACARLSRNLNEEEWRQFLGDEPYRKTCPDLP
jgi:WD40 repeat protein